jgi:hypothetical protein
MLINFIDNRGHSHVCDSKDLSVSKTVHIMEEKGCITTYTADENMHDGEDFCIGISEETYYRVVGQLSSGWNK